MHVARAFLQAVLLATLVLAAGLARAQTVGPTISVGSAPAAIAVNPVTNKVYVANEASNNVTVIDGSTHLATSVTVGTRPTWIAVNPETNKVYVSNFGNGPALPSVMVLNGANDTVTSTLAVGDVGWTAINPLTNKTYVLRYGNGDEVNIIQDETYVNTAATRSYKPVSIALNPYTNILYIVHQATGDVVAIDASVDSSTDPSIDALYPPLLCPNGSGGYKPSPRRTDPDPGPCINVTDVAVAVTVNPVTDMIYAVSSAASDQISVIRGHTRTDPHTFTTLTPPGVGSTARAIAVNPVTNKIYAAFAQHVVVVNGADNAMTVIPSGTMGGPVAVGINTTTNKIYVPNSDGTLAVIDGATNAASTLAIPAGAKAVAVNPVTNTMYVLTASGVAPIDGSTTDTAQTNPLDTTITPLPGNTGNTNGSITLNASSSSGFAAPRKVYFQIDSVDGEWKAAGGSGPYTATYTGLTNGTHRIYAFATNALDAPSIMTDVQNNPLVGNLVSYSFTVSGSGSPTKSAITSPTPGSTLTSTTVTFNWSAGTAVAERYLMAGTTPGGSEIYAGYQGAALSRTVEGLPANGATVYVRLLSWISGNWQFNDNTYTAMTAAGPAKSVMTSPAPDSKFASSTVTFSWSAGSGVAERYLSVGTTLGGYDIFGGYQGAATSHTVSGLPTDGRTLYVRLMSWIGGDWQYADYTYTAAGDGTPAKSVMTNPAPGSTLTSTTVTFQWTSGSSVAERYLTVGTTLGGANLYEGYQGEALSRTVSNLPSDGSTVYVRLFSWIGGDWQLHDSTYTAVR
jgi:YVTN family beta-propeller protein